MSLFLLNVKHKSTRHAAGPTPDLGYQLTSLCDWSYKQYILPFHWFPIRIQNDVQNHILVRPATPEFCDGSRQIWHITIQWFPGSFQMDVQQQSQRSCRNYVYGCTKLGFSELWAVYSNSVHDQALGKVSRAFGSVPSTEHGRRMVWIVIHTTEWFVCAHSSIKRGQDSVGFRPTW